MTGPISQSRSIRREYFAAVAELLVAGLLFGTEMELDIAFASILLSVADAEFAEIVVVVICVEEIVLAEFGVAGADRIEADAVDRIAGTEVAFDD